MKYDTVWDQRYQELVRYIEEFGDTRVPHKFARNWPLASWVNKLEEKL